MVDNEITLYARRWFFLLGLAVFQFLGGISFASFGEISNFYTQFYNIDHALVDWITNGRNIGAVFITVPLAWFAFKGSIGLRKMVVMVVVTSTIGMLFVTVALIRPSLVSLIFLGQLFLGISETIGIALPSTFAVLWFPEHQVGTAISMNVMGLMAGDTIGYLLPPYLLYSSDLGRNDTSYTLSAPILEHGRHTLQIMYGSYLGIAGFLAVLLCLFITDRPPKPPTAAQSKKENTVAEKKDRTMFCTETKSLFTNWSYVITTIALAMSFQVVFVENLIMSEIVHSLDLKRFAHLPSDLISGFVMSLWSLSNIVGLLLGGPLVNYCKRYKALIVVSLAFTFIATVVLAVGVILKKSAAIFFGNSLFGFFNGFTSVIALEILTQQTYPVEETVVNTWMTGALSIMALLLGVLGRIIYHFWGSFGVVTFQSALLLAAVFSTCFISPKNKRLDAGQNGLPMSSETPLLKE